MRNYKFNVEVIVVAGYISLSYGKKINTSKYYY